MFSNSNNYKSIMSLETYIDGQVQAFKKQGAPNVLFGLQNSTTFKLLPIFKAYESGSTDAPTEITAVQISKTYPFAELARVTLSTDLIVFDSGSNQYLIDNTKTITGLLNETIYYLEFKNGLNVFETEAFLVKVMDHNITWDMTIITWDSTLITFDLTTLNI